MESDVKHKGTATPQSRLYPHVDAIICLRSAVGAQLVFYALHLSARMKDASH